MQECKGMTPMPTSGHLDLTKDGEPVDQKVYRSTIGSLLYLCASCPDIMLSVCMCARYQAAPKECHLKAVKRIVRYLIQTPNFGIWYPNTTKKYTSMMIHVCHSRSRFLSCMYVHDDFMTESR